MLVLDVGQACHCTSTPTSMWMEEQKGTKLELLMLAFPAGAKFELMLWYRTVAL